MTPDAIRKVRDSMGLTQLELGLLFNVHSLTISKWERGILEPNTRDEAILEIMDGVTAERALLVKREIASRGALSAMYMVLGTRFGGQKTKEEP